MQSTRGQIVNYEDFASGRVIIQNPGFTKITVRLAQEIYCRCLHYLQNKSDICIYDPCCGGGYLLTSIGFLNFGSIKTIIGSDIDNHSLEFAEQNLGLLNTDGLQARINHLQQLYAQYGKDSHLQAIESANKLKHLCDISGNHPNISIFQTDILNKCVLKDSPFKADIVITDIPYENMTSWQDNQGERGGRESANDELLHSPSSIEKLLNNLIPILKSNSVVAICFNKGQRISSDNYIKLEKQSAGKRKFEILTLLG